MHRRMLSDRSMSPELERYLIVSIHNEICDENDLDLEESDAAWDDLAKEDRDVANRIWRSVLDGRKDLKDPPSSAIPLCERCRHKVTSHVADDEERRECMEWSCSCEQYQHPIDGVPNGK